MTSQLIYSLDTADKKILAIMAKSKNVSLPSSGIDDNDGNGDDDDYYYDGDD